MIGSMNEAIKLMTESEWNAICASASQSMAEYVPRFMTPISRVLSNVEGKLEGTGSYLAVGGDAFLLTNEHVAAAMHTNPLGHMFHGSNLVHPVRSNFASISAPTDAAIARVDMSNAIPAAAVPLSLYAERHEPEEKELLFIAGYPGQRTSFFFETLFSPLTPYLTQEDVVQTKVLGPHFFAVPWLPDRAWSSDPRSPGLSRPPGMSGSIVWNTRRLEFAQSQRDWSPEEARVTGLVFGWSDCSNWVYSTKVEYLRAALPQLIDALGPRTV